MTRQDLRNRHPFHSPNLATTLADRPAVRYNRHSLRHRCKALWARVRLMMGV